MKSYLLYKLDFIALFTLGIVVILQSVGTGTNLVVLAEAELIIETKQPLVIEVGPTPDTDEYKEALADIWIKEKEIHSGDYKITRKCKSEPNDEYIGSCKLVVRRGAKSIKRFETETGRSDWLRYGFFNFLGGKQKQLVVQTYSGGAHCCYDYYIYDLSHGFRAVYESSKFDSANQIGNELIPVDIDGDRVFEFYQDVMAFDYMGSAGHASASFPPAIFSFDKKKGRYILATDRFPKFVLNQLYENLTYLDKEIAKKRDYGLSKEDMDEYNQEYRVRETFLFLVYAGKKEKAWEYFRENYKSKISGKYMDEFRVQCIKEFNETFKADPTYRSIYGK